VHDVAALLEAQQHEAHLAPAEADALGQLTRGEAGFVLDRAGDEPDAVEDADRAQVGQGLDGCGALEGLTREEVRPAPSHHSHERYSCPRERPTMRTKAPLVDLWAYWPIR
jgi:hypothetical protein